jgi:hypothetical protein
LHAGNRYGIYASENLSHYCMTHVFFSSNAGDMAPMAFIEFVDNKLEKQIRTEDTKKPRKTLQAVKDTIESAQAKTTDQKSLNDLD